MRCACVRQAIGPQSFPVAHDPLPWKNRNEHSRCRRARPFLFLLCFLDDATRRCRSSSSVRECCWSPAQRVTSSPRRQQRAKIVPMRLSLVSTAGRLGPSLTAPDREKSTTGIYDVERSSRPFVKDFDWKVEFYIWFRWEANQVRLAEGFVRGGLGTIETVNKLREETAASRITIFTVRGAIHQVFRSTSAQFPRRRPPASHQLETPLTRRMI